MTYLDYLVARYGSIPSRWQVHLGYILHATNCEARMHSTPPATCHGVMNEMIKETEIG